MSGGRYGTYGRMALAGRFVDGKRLALVATVDAIENHEFALKIAPNASEGPMPSASLFD